MRNRILPTKVIWDMQEPEEKRKMVLGDMMGWLAARV
jgi:hypothetical protein